MDRRSCDNHHGKVNVFRTDGHEDGVAAGRTKTETQGRDRSGYHGDYGEETEQIAANQRLKRKSRAEKRERGVNEKLRYVG